MTTSEQVSTLLRKKPRVGFLESYSPNREHEPLDVLEQLSVALRAGQHNRAIELIESALNNPKELDRLDYVPDPQQTLTGLLEQLKLTPQPVLSAPKQSGRKPTVLFIFVGLAFIVAVAVAYLI